MSNSPSQNFASSLEAVLNVKHHEKFPNLPDLSFHVEAGKKYDRIVQSDGSYSSSVHAFVVRATGDLVKAAGWSAPAKSKTHPSGLAVRFNLSTPEGFAEALKAADFAGGYLYA